MDFPDGYVSTKSAREGVHGLNHVSCQPQKSSSSKWAKMQVAGANDTFDSWQPITKVNCQDSNKQVSNVDTKRASTSPVVSALAAAAKNTL